MRFAGQNDGLSPAARRYQPSASAARPSFAQHDGEIEGRVGEARIELERPLQGRHRLCLAAQRRQNVAEIGVEIRDIAAHRDRLADQRRRLGEILPGREHQPQIVQDAGIEAVARQGAAIMRFRLVQAAGLVMGDGSGQIVGAVHLAGPGGSAGKVGVWGQAGLRLSQLRPSAQGGARAKRRGIRPRDPPRP